MIPEAFFRQNPLPNENALHKLKVFVSCLLVMLFRVLWTQRLGQGKAYLKNWFFHLSSIACPHKLWASRRTKNILHLTFDNNSVGKRAREYKQIVLQTFFSVVLFRCLLVVVVGLNVFVFSGLSLVSESNLETFGMETTNERTNDKQTKFEQEPEANKKQWKFPWTRPRKKTEKNEKVRKQKAKKLQISIDHH